MANNTTSGSVVIKQNILPSTTAAGGVRGATAQDHFIYTGTFTLNGATPVTVVEPNLTANSVVTYSLKTVGGTVSPNHPNILTVTPGTGFTVAGTASDTSVYQYNVSL